MALNTTTEDNQIVVSTDISPKNTYVSNKSVLSENEEQMKSLVQPDDKNVESKGDEEETILVIVCDTCGDQGRENKLAKCKICKVGAEHTYCMAVMLEEVPIEWECYDCIEDKDRMQKIEEALSRKRKAKSLIDPIPDLNQDPIPDLNLDPIPDLNQDPIPDLNLDPIPDLNQDPIPDLNLDLNPGLHLSLGHASYNSNFQARKPKGLSLTPVLGQHYPEEEEEEEHCAKRPRVNTILFF